MRSPCAADRKTTVLSGGFPAKPASTHTESARPKPGDPPPGTAPPDNAAAHRNRSACPPTAPSIRARNSMADATPHTPNVTCTTNSTAHARFMQAGNLPEPPEHVEGCRSAFRFSGICHSASTQDPRRAVDLFHVVVPALGLVCPARRPACTAPERRSALSGPPSKTAAARARGAGAVGIFSSFPAAQSSG